MTRANRFAFSGVVLLLAVGCGKKPSVAQPSFEKFINAIAHLQRDTSVLVDGAKIEAQSIADPTAGAEEVVLVPTINVGEFGWTKFTPEGEESLASGDKMLTIRTEICMRAESGDGTTAVCARPNVYLFKALMRNEEGTWKIASTTYTDVMIVR